MGGLTEVKTVKVTKMKATRKVEKMKVEMMKVAKLKKRKERKVVKVMKAAKQMMKTTILTTERQPLMRHSRNQQRTDLQVWSIHQNNKTNHGRKTQKRGMKRWKKQGTRMRRMPDEKRKP